ncbi:MAG: HAMP domain-containing histidine kinase [Saprospiraceae bacterium]|nr:HAMP domain-containing histidine kinase [Candidatus Brachybacter algidus]
MTQRNQRNVLLFLAGIILAVLSILAFFYRGIKLKNRQLATQNIQINTQKDQLQNLNTVKDRLFGIISHDLRSPLSALKTYHIMSENDTMAIDKKEKYKTKTWQAINSMTDMLDNLLIWANAQIKGGSPDIKSFSLRESVGDTISEVKAQADKKSIVIINKVDIDQINTDNSIISIAVRESTDQCYKI